VILLLLACGQPEPAPVDCSTVPVVTWDSWSAGFFRTYCTSCHASTNTDGRNGALVGYDFDTEAGVIARSAEIRKAVFEDKTMPAGGGVYPDDLVLLDIYLTCSVPADAPR
jgi:hypothetical protein